jgi:hypothetical protein
MKTTVPIGILLTGVGLGLAACSDLSEPTEESPNFGLAKGNEKVTICHEGNTVTVGEPAVADHLAHGDVVGAINPPSGLVGWWPGDGKTDDIIGGNAGTLQGGATFALGKVAQAFKLDGVDDHVDLPTNALTSLTVGSVAMWFKIASARDQQISLFHLSDNGSLSFAEWALGLDQRIGVTSQDLITGTFLPSGRWQIVVPRSVFNSRTNFAFNHVVVVQDGVQPRLYLNGGRVGSLTGSDKTLWFDDAFKQGTQEVAALSAIFRNGVLASQFFEGLIDEFAIWNRALAAQEVQAIFNAGSAGMCKP